MILLISEEAKWLGFAAAFVLLMIVVSIIAYYIRTAECYEHEEDPVPDDMEPVTYADIMYCERPFIEHQYN